MILILLNYLNRWNINCANADLNVCSIVQNVYIFCNKFYLVYWLIHFWLNLLFATVIKWDIKYLENWRAMKLAVMYFGFARSQGWGLLVDKRGNDRECVGVQLVGGPVEVSDLRLSGSMTGVSVSISWRQHLRGDVEA